MDMHASAVTERDTASLYSWLEERILARDQAGRQPGLSTTCCAPAGRCTRSSPRRVRIHAPYTHVPYHQRIDDGFPNFVNNDHCLLSARATLHLTEVLPEKLAELPLAQTIWYIPTGLDIWNQKIIKAPGPLHARLQVPDASPPMPVVYWPDQEPLASTGR